MLFPFITHHKICTGLFAGLALSMMIAGCGSNSSQAFTGGPEFVYTADFDAAQISAFSFDGSKGTLTAITNSPFTADNKPVGVVAHPSKNFIYVGNNGDNTITAYSYDSTGAITRIAAHPLPAAPSQVLIDPSGSTVYALIPSLGQVVSYAVDPGSSDLTSSSAVTLNGGATPARMTFDANATNLYAVDTKGLMSVIAISGGGLVEAANSPFRLADQPLDIACCKSGNFYVVDFFAGKLVQYTTSTSNGALAIQRGTAVTTDNNPNRVALDKSGTYAIVTSQTKGSLTLFTLDTSSFAPTTTTLSATTGSGPSCILQDASGQFILTTNHDASSASAFQLASTLTVATTATTATGPMCGTVASPH